MDFEVSLAAELSALGRFAASTFLSDRRREARRRTLPTGDPSVLDGVGPDATSRVVDRDQIHRMLEQLPARQRAAVVLRVVGSVIALAWVRANDDRSGSAASADGQVSIQTWTANSYPATSARPNAASPTAINECATMFGPARAARARYTVAALRAVMQQAPEIRVNGAVLSQQVHLLLEGHQWIGAFAPAPAQDLATLGSTVRTLP